MDSANSLLLPSSTSNALTLWRTASLTPPTLKATIGLAEACASRSAIPCPSWTEGKTKMSAQLYKLGSRCSFTSPRSRKFFEIPKLLRCESKLLFRGPSPTITNIASLRSFKTGLAALIRKCNPLRGMSLPTKRITCLSLNPKLSLRALSPSVGLNLSGSTPFGTTRTLVLFKS